MVTTDKYSITDKALSNTKNHIERFDNYFQKKLANINDYLTEKYENYQINDMHLSYNVFFRRLSGNMEEKKRKYDIDDSETDEEFFERLRKRQKDIKKN